MNDFGKPANQIEACVWFLIALVALTQAIRKRSRTYAILAPTFLVFGVTDLIEAETGAWWKPWWLFALKAACVVVIFVTFATHYLFRPSRTDPAGEGEK